MPKLFLKKLAGKTPVDLAVRFFVVIFVVFFVFLSFERHAALKSYLNDLGTYDQVVWNTLHGHFFDNSSNMLGERNYLGAHFSPILLFFVPLYAIVASPKWLLFFQAVAVGASAFFIYDFAKGNLKKAYLGAVFLLSYLLNPFLHNGLLYDFHEAVLAVFFAAGAFYFLEKGKEKWFVLFAVLLSLSQEHLSLLVFMMGAYLIVAKKKYKLGAAAGAISLAYFALTMMALMPHFSATGNPSLISNTSSYPLRYSWLGKGFGEMAKNMFFHPFAIGKIVFSGERLSYLFALIVPIFSLAIFSWPIIIAIPVILINILSALPLTYSVFFYHSAVVVPFLYFSAIMTFRRWFLGNCSLEKLFALLILSFSAYVFYTGSAAPLASNAKWKDFLPGENAKKIGTIRNMIPADASISVQHNLGPHFSERRELYRFPLKIDESDFVVLDRSDPYEKSRFKFFDFGYALQMDQEEWQKKADELRASPDFKVFFDDGEYLVFKNIKKK